MLTICIGTEPKTQIPLDVLKYSIRRNTKKEVKFIPLLGKDTLEKEAGTGFTYLRWEIPKLLNYQGYAIYMDADMLCLGDISYLWRADELWPNKNSSVWCTFQEGNWQSSLMFIDCEKAKEDWPTQEFINEGLKKDRQRNFYHELMNCRLLKNPPQRIPDEWNHLNKFIPGQTKVLHYTKEPTQPWYYPRHQFKEVWEIYFKRALKEKYITKDQIKEGIRNFKKQTPTTRYEGLHYHYAKYIG